MVEHRRVEHSPAGSLRAWLLGATGAQFTTMPSSTLPFKHIKNHRRMAVFFMVEHRRVELLASTMPLWRATNCANAPCNVAYYNRCFLICKEVFFIFL